MLPTPCSGSGAHIIRLIPLRVLLTNEIPVHYQQGPNIVSNPPPIALNDSITLNPGAMALIPVLSNDTGTQLDPASVTIVSAPVSGSAQAKPSGKVFYTHNGAPGVSDSFQYTV